MDFDLRVLFLAAVLAAASAAPGPSPSPSSSAASCSVCVHGQFSAQGSYTQAQCNQFSASLTDAWVTSASTYTSPFTCSSFSGDLTVCTYVKDAAAAAKEANKFNGGGIPPGLTGMFETALGGIHKPNGISGVSFWLTYTCPGGVAGESQRPHIDFAPSGTCSVCTRGTFSAQKSYTAEQCNKFATLLTTAFIDTPGDGLYLGDFKCGGTGGGLTACCDVESEAVAARKVSEFGDARYPIPNALVTALGSSLGGYKKPAGASGAFFDMRYTCSGNHAEGSSQQRHVDFFVPTSSPCRVCVMGSFSAQGQAGGYTRPQCDAFAKGLTKEWVSGKKSTNYKGSFTCDAANGALTVCADARSESAAAAAVKTFDRTGGIQPPLTSLLETALGGYKKPVGMSGVGFQLSYTCPSGNKGTSQYKHVDFYEPKCTVCVAGSFSAQASYTAEQCDTFAASLTTAWISSKPDTTNYKDTFECTNFSGEMMVCATPTSSSAAAKELDDFNASTPFPAGLSSALEDALGGFKRPTDRPSGIFFQMHYTCDAEERESQRKHIDFVPMIRPGR